MMHGKCSIRTFLLTGAALVTAAGLSVFAQGRGAGPAGRSSPAGETADFSPRTPYLPQTPADEAKGFILPTGYRMELVASDPDVISPGVVVFDGDGRMYVAELIGYMQDAEATDEHAPVSRISRWESTKHDGHYDKHTVFVDHLVAPRMILPMLDGSILTSETDSDDVVQWTDTNGDGVADQSKVVFTGIGQSGDANIEHQKAGLVWNMDNWIYTTYNAFRIRWTPSGFLREPTGPNGGQWGLSMDDDGKPWFVDAGGERGPMNFQYPIEYGSFTPCPSSRGRGFGARGQAAAAEEATDPNCPPGMENGFEKDFAVVWPAPGIGDMQGGLNRTRMPARNLNHFTAATGPVIVRGDRLPADMKGDLLFTEPVGRLIRRAKIVNIEGLTELQNAYPGSEFLTSQDQLFRPVNMTNAPDGTVYIADLYHGIIQERQWSGPGTYLRAKIEQYQLDKVAHYGRIWRLRYDGRPAVPETDTNPGQPALAAIPLDLTPPRMYEETPAQLVAHLSHPNGWWRSTAQRILILKQDKSVVPALQQMARSSDNLLARFHALWTLEGLGALDAGLVRQEMKDSNPRMRIQAIRASETLYKAGDKSFADDYRAMTKDSDTDVAIQAMLTVNLFKLSDADDVIKATMAANHAKGVQLIGAHLLEAPATNAFGGRGGASLSAEDRQLLEQGSQVFSAVCFSCHGTDGRGQPLAGAAPGVTMAPPLAGSPRVQGHKDYVIHVLLNGLTGPIGDKTYAEVMVPMGANSDAWVAGIASYIRNNFGNAAGMVTPEDVARVRKADASRKTPWTVAEIESELPRQVSSDGWKLSASAGQDAVEGALNLRGWNSGAPQAPGMWFQVELPTATNVTEVRFDSPAQRVRTPPPAGARGAAPARGGRGARGRGGFQVTTISQTPVSYQIQTSMDGRTWSKPVAEGKGDGTRTDVSFNAVKAKFIRITQTGTPDNDAHWTISNLRLYESPASK
jgi:putative membrane-bound dehydrogenase-like protein